MTELNEILRKGELLINIVGSTSFSPELRKEALNRMRENVVCLTPEKEAIK